MALLDLVAGNDVIYNMLAGGLLLGAFFMATDYVTTPITGKGKLIFGIGCGLITFLIRQFGSYPEGVSFSILLMNIVTPYIDRFTMTKPSELKRRSEKNERKDNASSRPYAYIGNSLLPCWSRQMRLLRSKSFRRRRINSANPFQTRSARRITRLLI